VVPSREEYVLTNDLKQDDANVYGCCRNFQNASVISVPTFNKYRHRWHARTQPTPHAQNGEEQNMPHGTSVDHIKPRHGISSGKWDLIAAGTNAHAGNKGQRYQAFKNSLRLTGDVLGSQVGNNEKNIE
jgi:hypothetical protein